MARGFPVRAEFSPVALNEHFGWATESLLLAGGIGLSIFFCLSGYRIARPFVRAYLAGKPMPALGPYAANRLLRIVPAFWLAVTIYLVVFNRSGESPEGIAAVYPFAQTYLTDPGPLTHSIGHAWSIDVELTFYALIPLAAYAVTRLTPRSAGFWGRLAVVLVLVGLTMAGSFALQWNIPNSSLAIHTLPLVLVSFLPGVAMAAVEPAALPLLRGQPWARWLGVATFVAGATTFVVLIDAADYLGRPDEIPALRRLAETLIVTFGPAVLMTAALILQWVASAVPGRSTTGPCSGWASARTRGTCSTWSRCSPSPTSSCSSPTTWACGPCWPSPWPWSCWSSCRWARSATATSRCRSCRSSAGGASVSLQPVPASAEAG